jgi:hypothetical protein
MNETEQNYPRHAIAKTIRHLLKNHPKQHNGKTKMENSKQHKEENSRTQADIGKTIVIIR